MVKESGLHGVEGDVMIRECACVCVRVCVCMYVCVFRGRLCVEEVAFEMTSCHV